MSEKTSTTRENQTNSETSEFEQDVLEGLTSTPKFLSCKYFYDQRGSELFEQICETPEYYLTRTELAIMQDNIGEIAESLGPKIAMVEFGSGSSIKTQILLEHVSAISTYLPVDISGDHLAITADALSNTFPDILIHPIAADFTAPFEIPEGLLKDQKVVVYFPGSTIGNFEIERARELLQNIANVSGSGGGFLVGIDLIKDPEILHAAYNDSEGITEAFNLNLLERINGELGADIEISNFKHRAVFNSEPGRMEIYIDSLVEQSIEIGDQTIEFEQNEAIFTEYSHKYELDHFKELAAGAGFQFKQMWTDSKNYFGVLYFEQA